MSSGETLTAIAKTLEVNVRAIYRWRQAIS